MQCCMAVKHYLYLWNIAAKKVDIFRSEIALSHSSEAECPFVPPPTDCRFIYAKMLCSFAISQLCAIKWLSIWGGHRTGCDVWPLLWKEQLNTNSWWRSRLHINEILIVGFMHHFRAHSQTFSMKQMKTRPLVWRALKECSNYGTQTKKTFWLVVDSDLDASADAANVYRSVTEM